MRGERRSHRSVTMISRLLRRKAPTVQFPAPKTARAGYLDIKIETKSGSSHPEKSKSFSRHNGTKGFEEAKRSWMGMYTCL